MSSTTFKSKKYILPTAVIVSTIFSFINFVILFVFSSSGLGWDFSLNVVLLPLMVFIAVYLYIVMIDATIGYLDKKDITTSHWKRWIIFFLITLATSGLISLVTYKTQSIPAKLDVASSELQKYLFFFFPNYLVSVIIYVVVEVWNTIEKNNLLLISLATSEKENIQSQLSALQQKLNPHFLFNSLSVLSELVYESPIKANTFIEEFTKVYRYVLEVKEETIVSVSNEIEFVNSYVFLQKIRFGNNISFENQLSKDALNKSIPPLSLQMLIENAIKHNEVSKAKPLFISISNTDEYIAVSNMIQARLEKPNSPGIGISTLQKTYDLISKSKPEFVVTKTKFVAKLPFINESQ